MVTQLENSRLSSSVQPVNINSAISDAVRNCIDKLQAKRQSIDIVGVSEDQMLYIEPSMLALTIQALLSNASDASPIGARIVLNCHTRGNRVAVQVIDHGIGMTQEQKDMLFKPFGRVDATTFDKSGVGLSLYTSRMIAHAFDGELSVESVAKRGTIASLTLPISTAKASSDA